MRSTDRRAGFTLIEVMAAVAILALSYTFLSRQGIEGLLWEGEADRLLRASLVADRWLADLETQQLLGTAPVVGHLEQSSDEFAVVVEIKPFELPPGLLPTTPGAPDPGAGSASLFPPPGRGQPALLTVELTVSWHDGLSERSLQRTTFVLDTVAVADLLGSAGVGVGTEPPPPEGEAP